MRTAGRPSGSCRGMPSATLDGTRPTGTLLQRLAWIDGGKEEDARSQGREPASAQTDLGAAFAMNRGLGGPCLLVALIGIAFALPACGHGSRGERQEPAVRVADYGTSASAIQKAANDARGRILTFPEKRTYMMSQSLDLPSDITIEGNGSVLKTPGNSTAPGSSDGILDIVDQRNVSISGLVFDGNIDNQSGWSQSRHEVRILGSSQNVRVERCLFRNLIGDGVYVGSGLPSNVTIASSTFTGSHANRNGVSVISASAVAIQRNTFLNMARPDMPGAVDIEPNRPSDQLRSITVANNTVLGQPGLEAPGRRAMTLNNHADAEIDTITFSGNDVSGAYFTRAGIALINQPTGSRAMNVSASGNHIHDLGPESMGVELAAGVTASVTGNQIANVGSGIQSDDACLTNSTGNAFMNTPNGGLVVSNTTC